MKTGGKIILIIGGALLLLGVVVMAVAMLFGAKMSNLFTGGLGITNINPGMGYEDMDNQFSFNGEYTVPAQGLTALEIKWEAGSVELLVADREDILLMESAEGSIDEKSGLRYQVENGVLTVQYVNKGVSISQGKALTVQLPAALAESLEMLDISGASAQVNVDGIKAETLEVDTASGDALLGNITAGQVRLNSASGHVEFFGEYDALSANTASGDIVIMSSGDNRFTEIDTASGNVYFYSYGESGSAEISCASGSVDARTPKGSCREIDIDTASGSIYAEGVFYSFGGDSASGQVVLAAQQCPTELNIETTSGDVEITVPEDSGFELEFDTASGTLKSALPIASRGGEYVCGNGGGEFEIETTSGNVTINKGI